MTEQTSSASDEKSHLPKLTNTYVFRLALPVTLAYITTPLLGLVDTTVIGQLGNEALLGGLAISAVIFDLILGTFNFIQSSTSGMTAQALGARNLNEIKLILMRTFLIAMGSGLVILIASPLILWISLYLITMTDAVEAATVIYFGVRIFGVPFALANYALIGWMIGQGRTGTILAIQLLINGTNIALSIYFGLVLEWSIWGVAFATVIAEAFGAMVGLFICYRRLITVDPTQQSLNVSGFKTHFFNRDIWMRLSVLNAHIMARSFALQHLPLPISLQEAASLAKQF